MAIFRLALVVVLIVALSYVAFHRGLLHDFSLVNRPAVSSSPTPQPRVHRSRRGRRLARMYPENPSHAGQLSGMRPGPALEVPGVRNPVKELPSLRQPTPQPSSQVASLPQTPFPREFEGCWEGGITQPDNWTFVHGPIVTGWTPATYVLCFHHSGPTPEISFSTTSSYPVVSDWVVSETGSESNHTDLLYSGEDFVVLRAVSSLPLHMKILGILPGPTGVVSSRTDFHCTYLPTDRLYVEASVVQQCSHARSIDCKGDTWITQSWHTEFSRRLQQ